MNSPRYPTPLSRVLSPLLLVIYFSSAAIVLIQWLAESSVNTMVRRAERVARPGRDGSAPLLKLIVSARHPSRATRNFQIPQNRQRFALGTEADSCLASQAATVSYSDGPGDNGSQRSAALSESSGCELNASRLWRLFVQHVN
jgi:hypothetical protein